MGPDARAPSGDDLSMEPYHYAHLAGGTRRLLLFETLAAALYTAILDVAEQHAVPIGIRRGRTILYRHAQLVALHARFAEQLAAGAHGPVCQALEEIAAARCA